MKYSKLGTSDLAVSTLCLGTMKFGKGTDKVAAAAMFDLCRDAGINFFDCADFYRDSQAEDIFGELITDCRDEIVVATKLNYPTVNDVAAHGSCRQHIFNSVEDSLCRLGTDYIDLCYLHNFNGGYLIEETLRALNDLVCQGKIWYLAASNFAAWELVKINEISKKHDWERFVCIRPLFDLINRQAEADIMPMAKSENIAVVSYSSLSEDLLTGGYNFLENFGNKRFQEGMTHEVSKRRGWEIEVTEQFANLAKKYGYHPNSMAIRWIASHPVVTSTIIEARSLEQLEILLDSLRVNMTKQLWEEISSLSPPPSSSTGQNSIIN